MSAPRSFLLGLMLLLAAGFAATRATAQTPVPVTFDNVMEYLQIGLPEERIASLVQQSPSSFVLGEEQLRQLKQAGAGELLLAAMQKMTRTEAVVGSDVTDVVLVLDCSGSMNDAMPDGSTKWAAAQRAAIDLVQHMPAGRKLSLIVYGTDIERACGSIDVLRPLSVLTEADKAELVQTMERLSPAGATPIAASLRVAGRELARGTGMSTVVLVTDGAESCRGNPAAEAADLMRQFPRMKAGINVIGFCLRDAEIRQVEQIARAGHGRFYDAQTAGQLLEGIRRLERTILRAGLVGRPNLDGLSPLDRLLIEQLADPSLQVREAAAKSVRQRNLKAAVPALAALIIEREMGGGLNSSYDRDEAIVSLRQLAPETMAAVLGEALHSPHFRVRCWAIDMIQKYEVAAAVECVEGRLVCLTDKDVNPGLINGYDEADRLFNCLKALAPPRLEQALVRLLSGESANVKAWAAKRLPDLQ